MLVLLNLLPSFDFRFASHLPAGANKASEFAFKIKRIFAGGKNTADVPFYVKNRIISICSYRKRVFGKETSHKIHVIEPNRSAKKKTFDIICLCLLHICFFGYK